jgi:hypothetical protein
VSDVFARAPPTTDGDDVAFVAGVVGVVDHMSSGIVVELLGFITD